MSTRKKGRKREVKGGKDTKKIESYIELYIEVSKEDKRVDVKLVSSFLSLLAFWDSKSRLELKEKSGETEMASAIISM